MMWELLRKCFVPKAERQRAEANELKSYLPFLNEFLRLAHVYPHHALQSPLKETVVTTLDTIAKECFKTSNHDAIPDRPLTARDFYKTPFKTIRHQLPDPLPEQRLSSLFAESAVRKIKDADEMILGTQVETTPPVFYHHPRPILSIPFDHRFRHTYLIGRTGSGKSNVLKHLIRQDMMANKGVIVLSPENQIFDDLFCDVPPDRLDDFVYIDPTDMRPQATSICWNPFSFEENRALPAHERAQLLLQKSGETYTIFERALGDLGVKMTTLMNHTAYALCSYPHATILDIDRLLNPEDPHLRQAIIRTPHIDDRTKRFWHGYDSSTYYKSAYEPVMNRLDPLFRFPLSSFLSNHSFSFTETLTRKQPRIIFLNLSKMRGIEAQIIGQLLIADIQQALLRREQIPEYDRVPYYFYIDEFSLFTTSEQSFADLFERARKYKMGVTLAHQVSADLPSKLFDVIVGNVATMIVMQLAAGDAPYFARELQLHTAHGRQNAQGPITPAILQNLPVGRAIVKIPSWDFGIPVSFPFINTAATYSLDELALIRNELPRISKEHFGCVVQETASTYEVAESVPDAGDIDSVTEPVRASASRTQPEGGQTNSEPSEAEVFKIRFE